MFYQKFYIYFHFKSEPLQGHILKCTGSNWKITEQLHEL